MRTEQKSEVELQVSREYEWHRFPMESSIAAPCPDAKYLGKERLNEEVHHFFTFEEDSKRYYVVGKEEDIELYGSKVYRQIRSRKFNAFIVLNEDDLKNNSEIPQEERSQLLNILTKLGEKI